MLQTQYGIHVVEAFFVCQVATGSCVSCPNSDLFPVLCSVLFLAQHHILTRASRLLASGLRAAFLLVEPLQSFGEE